MKNKKIVIAGGSGFIGRNIAAYFAAGNEIVILTRNINDSANNAYEDFDLPKELADRVRMVEWDGKTQGAWIKEIDGCDVVINLAGKSVNCRYTKKNKQEIFDSRTNATKAIGEAIRKAVQPPELWINAASATTYRHAMDRPQDEFTGEMHNDFSVQVCKLWEQTFFAERTPFTRKVALRMAITLGTGGVMIPYLNLVKFGLGGHQGSGRQMYSWVHVKDVCRVIAFIEERKDLEGVYNVSAPNPVSNNVFMKTLRKVTGHFIGLPAYTWMLKIGAAIIGTETELILKSRWVVPTKLLQEGFTFEFPLLQPALQNIIDSIPRKRYHLF
jgi:uncharacterized protein (TIGR01777 family)